MELKETFRHQDFENHSDINKVISWKLLAMVWKVIIYTIVTKLGVSNSRAVAY